MVKVKQARWVCVHVLVAAEVFGRIYSSGRSGYNLREQHQQHQHGNHMRRRRQHYKHNHRKHRADDIHCEQNIGQCRCSSCRKHARHAHTRVALAFTTSCMPHQSLHHPSSLLDSPAQSCAISDGPLSRSTPFLLTSCLFQIFEILIKDSLNI